jgi:hypothetical protein
MWQAGHAFLDSKGAGPIRRFVFQVPPSNSIDHLHLHVFEGKWASWVYGSLVYNPRANPWCETVAATLRKRFLGQPSSL